MRRVIVIFVIFDEPMFETILDIPHAGKHDEREKSCEYRDRIHAEANRHAERGYEPQARRGRYSVDDVLAMNDETRSNEADTGDDAGCKLQGLEIDDSQIRGVDVIGHEDEKTCTQGDEPERTRSRRLPREDRALCSDDAA